MTVGVPPCTVAQTELVVPRSMPMTSSPKVILQRPEERLGLLVIGVLVEKRGQLRPRSRLHARRHEQPREQPAGAAVVGIQLHSAGRPDGGDPGVARFHRAAGSAHGGSEARGVVREGGRIGGDRLGETAPLFAFLRGRERRVGPGFGLLPLQLDQLGGDLVPLRIELARGLESEDGLRALAVERRLHRLLVELARRADAGEPLGPQHALAALACAAFLFGDGELPALQRHAVGLRKLGPVVAVVSRAHLLVGQHLVSSRETLEPFREERPELAGLLAVPGVGMEALRLLEVCAADGTAVGVGSDAEQLVVRQPIPARLQLLQLVLHVGRKLDDPSGARFRRAQTVPPARERSSPRVSPRYPTVQSPQKVCYALSTASASNSDARSISSSDTVSGGARRTTRSPTAFTSSPSSRAFATTFGARSSPRRSARRRPAPRSPLVRPPMAPSLRDSRSPARCTRSRR